MNFACDFGPREQIPMRFRTLRSRGQHLGVSVGTQHIGIGIVNQHPFQHLPPLLALYHPSSHLDHICVLLSSCGAFSCHLLRTTRIITILN